MAGALPIATRSDILAVTTISAEFATAADGLLLGRAPASAPAS